MLQLARKFGGSALNPYEMIVLTSSSGAYHVLNDEDQFGPNTILSQIMTC